MTKGAIVNITLDDNGFKMRPVTSPIAKTNERPKRWRNQGAQEEMQPHRSKVGHAVITVLP